MHIQLQIKHLRKSGGDNTLNLKIKPYLDKALKGIACNNKSYFIFENLKAKYYRVEYTSLIEKTQK